MQKLNRRAGCKLRKVSAKAVWTKLNNASMSTPIVAATEGLDPLTNIDEAINVISSGQCIYFLRPQITQVLISYCL